MKVLIVEDDTSSRMILQNHLESWNYQVLTADDINQAWDMITAQRPEIVLIDWVASEMDRLELCSKTRKLDNDKYTYIIFLTNEADNREIVNALDSGADDYLCKPFDKNIIRSRIKVGEKVIYYEDEMRKSRQKTQDSQKQLDQVNLQLELTYKKLMETAHRAGMAEVASGVLHNVGNLLNSVNVSAELAYEKVHRSELANIQKLAEMLKQNSGNLADYLTNDAGGKHIPEYLFEAASHSAKQKDEILDNLTSLIKNIEHVKAVVNSQRLYTQDNPKDLVSLCDLIENSIQINNAGLEYYKIDVIREFQDLGKILIDKQRVLQILVSLIDNAQQALAESQNRPRLLMIRTAKTAENTIKIEISDNGTGIKPEDLSKIFSSGFTTKPTGHGFGLHSCKMAIDDMHGTISVQSLGNNRGAAFTLELPLTNIEVQNANKK
ncbi:MAG: response regulator [Planctomycetaceae bacterium]|nr:response regulator [Planctomycetaceae bacterium]